MSSEQQVVELRSEIAELLVANQSLQSANHALATRVKNQDEKIASLEQQLGWFIRQVHGERSERRIVSSGPLSEQQMHLGEQLAGERRVPESKRKVDGYERRAPSNKQPLEGSPENSGLRFDPNVVPVEEIEVPNRDIEGLSSDEYEVIDERCTYRLAQRQGPYVVLKYVQKVVKIKKTGAVLTPQAPDSLFEGSFACISFLVGLLLDKFLYHLPLYRQHQRLRAAGVMLSRATLTNYVHRTCALFELIHKAQLKQVLKSRVLALDETPVKAGQKKKGKLKTGYFWPLYGDRDEVVFIFQESRSGKWLDDLLKDFKGTLLTDGYAAYERFCKRVTDIIHAQCWSHARRAIEKAKGTEPELVEKTLTLLAKLWKVEEEIRDKELTGEAKKQYRQQHSRPVVVDILTCFQFFSQRQTLLPSNPFTKGVNYVLQRKEALQVFLDNPAVALDTNHLERELRPIPCGRKNWLFCWTEVGARYVAIIQSLLVTCKLQGINPYVYLVDVLQRVDTHPNTEIEKLTPRLWKQHYGSNPIPDPLTRANNDGWLKKQNSSRQEGDLVAA